MPVTIGSLTDVPVPGDPVRSAWAQNVSRLPIHHFATVAALKAGWTSPPDGSFAYVTGDDALCVAKGGTWRWWRRDFGNVTGNAAWITYTAAATAASSTTGLAVDGRTLTLRGTIVVATPGTSGNTAMANMPAAYRSAQQLNLPSTIYTSITHALRMIVQTNGDLQAFWAGAASAVGTIAINLSWQLPDLLAA